MLRASPLPDWREEPVGRHHDRKGFDCGSPDLNDYLIRYARQNHESGGAKTFVSVSPAESTRVLGYCSISPGRENCRTIPTRPTFSVAQRHITQYAFMYENDDRHQ